MTIESNRALMEVLHTTFALHLEELGRLLVLIGRCASLVEDIVLCALQEVVEVTLTVQVDHQLTF